MKTKLNEFVRIATLIIIISIIGIGYTLFWAFQHNGEHMYTRYGVEQVIITDPALTFFQVLVITLLSLSLVGSIMYLIYSHGGKIKPEKLFSSSEKGIIFSMETILLTIILILIIIIPTNIMLEHGKQTTPNSITYPQTNNNNGSNNSI